VTAARTTAAWWAGAGLLFVAGGACFVGAATHHYTDAGFVVNLMYELVGAFLWGGVVLIVLIQVVAYVLRRRRRPPLAETSPGGRTPYRWRGP